MSNNLQSIEQNLTAALSNVQDANVAGDLREVHQGVGVAAGGCAGSEAGRPDAVAAGRAFPVTG